MAYLEQHTDLKTGDIIFNGRISRLDIEKLTEPFDLAVLRQPCETAADFLLKAEFIFRRAYERAAGLAPTVAAGKD